MGWAVYNHGSIGYFVKLEEQIVAVFTLTIKHESIFISSLAVSPAYRRLGIAFFTLAEVEKLCRRMNTKWLELSVLKRNVPARKLYEKFGFSTAKEKRWSYILTKRI